MLANSPVGRVIVFDLDGTVWDSAPGILACFEETLADFGLVVPPRVQLTAHLGPPLMTTLAALGIAEEQLDEARIVYRRHYREHGETDCVLYDGMPELLDRLRADGFRLATATSKGVEPVHRMLEHFDLARRFDVVAAASMTAVGHGKADVIAEALAGSDPAGGIMVGDRSFDIEGGREFGLETVGVTWGYAPPGELESAGPDHIVGTVAELADLLVGAAISEPSV